MSQHKYLAFDIEVATEFPIDAKDWMPYRPLGIACAATLAADSDAPRLWHSAAGDRMNRDETGKLVDYLAERAAAGYTVLTWNGLGFDFDVLAEESGRTDACSTLAANHVDMMFHVLCALGYPVSLAAAAQGMRLPGKTEGMAGHLAPRMWADGRRQEVLDYVAQDVRATLALGVTGDERGHMRWITRRGKPSQLDLPHGWLPVAEARKLPMPDTSWMTDPIPRDRFTRWMKTG